MTKREAGQLYHIRKEISIWQNELNKLQNKSYIKSPEVTGMPMGSGTSDKTADRSVEEVELERMIREYESKASKLEKEIMMFIASIEDSCDRMIVVLRVMCRMTWNEVAREIGGGNTEDGVRKRFERLF